MVGHRNMNRIAQTHSKLHDPDGLTGTPVSGWISAFDSSNSSSEYSSRRTELLVTFELLMVELDALVEILDDLLGENTSVESASSSVFSASSENSMFSFLADDFEILPDGRRSYHT